MTKKKNQILWPIIGQQGVITYLKKFYKNKVNIINIQHIKNLYNYIKNYFISFIYINFFMLYLIYEFLNKLILNL